jgi:hypothetical protein
MHLSAGHKPNRLPKRFPIGTTYVLEGRGGEHGDLRVDSRYVVLPGGQRINLASDSAGPRSPWVRSRRRSGNGTSNRGKAAARAKKIMVQAGTSRQRHR